MPLCEFLVNLHIIIPKSNMPLLEMTPAGLYCPQADVYIDPSKKVERAIITHAHGDHAKRGMGSYLCHTYSDEVLRYRLGKNIKIQTMDYGATTTINGVKIGFFPAGHIPGSAQVRLAYRDEAWVVTGDYKVEDDGVSTAYEPVPCSHFVSESTFGLPIYKWQDQAVLLASINHWWSNNRAQGINSIIHAYSLGKAQRLIALLDHSIGDIFIHHNIYETNQSLAKYITLPACKKMQDYKKANDLGSLIISPQLGFDFLAIKKFAPYLTAECSGWMLLENQRLRRKADAAFALSDHADWDGLLYAIHATGAQNIYLTHGYTQQLSRYLNERGYNASELDHLRKDSLINN